MPYCSSPSITLLAGAAWNLDTTYGFLGQDRSFVPHQPHEEGQETEDNVGLRPGHSQSNRAGHTFYTHTGTHTHTCG